MKDVRYLLLIGAVLCLGWTAPVVSVHAQSATTFTYQGYLEEGGGPAAGPVDLELKLFDGTSGGSQVGSTLTKDDVSLTDGVFVADLDFGAVFGAEARYLEVGVRDGGSTGSYTTLGPREALRPAPLATALPGLRVEPATDSNDSFTPNLIGGSPSNRVADGVTGATIGGGGSDFTSHFIDASAGTIGGGNSNRVTAGQGTVGGGAQNEAGGGSATVAGGYNNEASGNTATVPGGRDNVASGVSSFAAGRRAKAHNDGAFVWADSENADFASTGADQFLVRANGFIGFNRATTITSSEAFGVRANTSGAGYGGMYMETSSTDGRPFYGYATDGSVRAYHYYDPAAQEWILNVSGTALRVNQDGDLTVAGRLTKASGSFTIDHPQAPTEKTLSHSFVESPDMMNVYNGTVALGAEGTATVKLPGYFEALNKDFRYQLTPIGAPGPNLHVAAEIKDNRFQIAGGVEGMRVSWQVTGIRNDPYARKHRIQVEDEKALEDRGAYLHPEVYEQPPQP